MLISKLFNSRLCNLEDGIFINLADNIKQEKNVKTKNVKHKNHHLKYLHCMRNTRGKCRQDKMRVIHLKRKIIFQRTNTGNASMAEK